MGCAGPIDGPWGSILGQEAGGRAGNPADAGFP
jgi:hypothetical protein